MEERYADVFDALADTPEQALNLKARATLMSEIREAVRAWDLPQAQAARRLGVTQPRLNDLLQGKIDKFSLDALFLLARPAGLAVELQVSTAA